MDIEEHADFRLDENRDREGWGSRPGMGCSVAGCARPVDSRGLCGAHRMRMIRYGDPNAGTAFDDESLADRLERGLPAYRPVDACWIWQGAKNDRGYGQIRMHGKAIYAHRAMYEIHVGPIAKGLELDHLCREPACVNPAHLEPVTHRENIRRGLNCKTSPASLARAERCVRAWKAGRS